MNGSERHHDGFAVRCGPHPQRSPVFRQRRREQVMEDVMLAPMKSAVADHGRLVPNASADRIALAEAMERSAQEENRSVFTEE